jgi:hypothetical protein
VRVFLSDWQLYYAPASCSFWSQYVVRMCGIAGCYIPIAVPSARRKPRVLRGSPGAPAKPHDMSHECSLSRGEAGRPGAGWRHRRHRGRSARRAWCSCAAAAAASGVRDAQVPVVARAGFTSYVTRGGLYGHMYGYGVLEGGGTRGGLYGHMYGYGVLEGGGTRHAPHRTWRDVTRVGLLLYGDARMWIFLGSRGPGPRGGVWDGLRGMARPTVLPYDLDLTVYCFAYRSVVWWNTGGDPGCRPAARAPLGLFRSRALTCSPPPFPPPEIVGREGLGNVPPTGHALLVCLVLCQTVGTRPGTSGPTAMALV